MHAFPNTENINKRLQMFLEDLLPPDLTHTKPMVVNDAIAFAVCQALETLSRNERDCICCRYGIVGLPMQLEDISEQLEKTGVLSKGATRERVRQLIAKGLNKLRKAEYICAMLQQL